MPTNKQFWVMPSAAAMLIVASLFLLQAYRVEYRTNQKTFIVQKQTPFAPSTPIQMGAVELTTNPVRFEPGGGPFTAPAGKQYAIVGITVTNRTEKTINVLPTADMYLKDDKGNVIYVTPYGLTDPFRAGELLAAETIKGDVSFLVTKNTHYTLYFDAIWSGSVLPFRLD